jgi:serine/threonine protein phosphatase PrpC
MGFFMEPMSASGTDTPFALSNTEGKKKAPKLHETSKIDINKAVKEVKAEPKGKSIGESISHQSDESIEKSTKNMKDSVRKDEAKPHPKKLLKKTTKGGVLPAKYEIYSDDIKNIKNEKSQTNKAKLNSINTILKGAFSEATPNEITILVKILAKEVKTPKGGIKSLMDAAFSRAAELNAVPELVNFLNKELKVMLDMPKEQFTDVINCSGEQWETKRSNCMLGEEIRNEMREFTWKHFDVIAAASIEKTENIPFAKQKNKLSPFPVEFNNYGIIPDNVKAIKFFDGKVQIEGINLREVKSFEFDGTKYTFGEKDEANPLRKKGVAVYDEKQKAIFFSSQTGSIENHDRVGVKKLKDGSYLMTITDGCGQSHTAALAAEKVKDKVNEDPDNIFINCQSTHETHANQMTGIKRAQLDCINYPVTENAGKGDTTMAQVYMRGLVLTAVSIGDAKVIVMRRDKKTGTFECINLIKPVRISPDSSDSGGRFSASGPPPELDKIVSASFQCMENEFYEDFVMPCSDGITDCFDPDELKDGSKSLEENLSNALIGCKTEEDIANKIQEKLHLSTREEKKEWFENEGQVKHKPGWGKMDNANFVVVKARS